MGVWGFGGLGFRGVGLRVIELACEGSIGFSIPESYGLGLRFRYMGYIYVYTYIIDVNRSAKRGRGLGLRLPVFQLEGIQQQGSHNSCWHQQC